MGLLNTSIGDAESVLLCGILLAIWIRDSWEIYLLFRQWKVVKNTTIVPNVLVRFLPIEFFSIVRLYYLEVLVYLMVYTFFDIIIKTVILLFDVIYLFWKLGISVAGSFNVQASEENVISIFFVMIVHTAQSLYLIAFRIYFQFAIENRYSIINHKTFATFMITSILSYLLKMMGLLIYVPAILFIVQLTGEYFFFSVWLLRLIFVLIITFVFMDFIFPMMGNFEPLAPGELKNSIQELASQVGFPLAQIYVYKASETSTERNALLYGFCRGRRIVLYDTLIDHLSMNEIVGVVAHELGHWKCNHLVKKRVFIEIYYAITFTAAHFLFPLDIIYRVFNFRDSKPTIIGLIIVFDFLLIPSEYVFTFLTKFLTRYFEFQADAFAAKLGQGKYLRSALINSHKDSSDFPADDWLFSTFSYDHPTLSERLDKLPK